MVFGVGKMTKLTIDILGDIGRWYASNSDLTIDLEKLLKMDLKMTHKHLGMF